MKTMTTFDKSKLPSRHVTEGPERAPHRSYLYAMGLTETEIHQPFVGVASCWNEAAPCNIALMRQAQSAKRGVKEAGGTPREFCTITVTDGMAMGHEGMKSSLVSREVIADSVELTMRGHCYDGLIGLAGCDKSLPGMMMSMLRLNVPSVFLYGGSIMPGKFKGKDVTVVDIFEGVGQFAAGKMPACDLDLLERHACPGAGACGGQFTANTMACVAEAIGLALPYSSGPPAEILSRDDFALKAGQAVMELLAKNIRPRDICTRKAFENAAAVVAATGGSTNAALHLPAMANEAGIKFDLFDVADIFRRTPYLASLKPGGAYVAKDMWEAGGVPMLMRTLLDGGYIDGSCMTVTGKTVAENLKDVKFNPNQKVMRAYDNPLAATGGVVGLRGNLAPEGAIVKIAGLKHLHHRGPARVFDCEEDAFEAVDKRFRETFVRLFGGGSARLSLTDPQNLVETGIEIEAKLPGRREQGLALLSGGERSLTAIALVFALLKVSPTPVCVMDEVDAMLDEANVGRFRDLLVELSQDTQYIIITHNRNTVQAADVIYGVTMGRDSSSQIISLRLDQVTDEMLARG